MGGGQESCGIHFRTAVLHQLDEGLLEMINTGTFESLPLLLKLLHCVHVFFLAAHLQEILVLLSQICTSIIAGTEPVSD